MLVNLLRRGVRGTARSEAGQMAWGFLLLILFVFMIFAVSFDAGLWFFDHRTAQNQAEAAALAAVLELPSADDTLARAQAHDYLQHNGVDDPLAQACDGTDPVSIEDTTGDGEYDLVRVCLSRDAGVIFSALSGITNVRVSASAAALIGRANISEVMPWAIVPPDPDCQDGDPYTVDVCLGDIDGDGVVAECDFADCPWGLNKQQLYLFKSGGGGNTGIIDACGNGAVGYRECIEGESATGFSVGEGETVETGLQGGNLGVNTDNALNERYATEVAEGYQCDVSSTPFTETGHDPDGRERAYAMFDPDTAPKSYCPERLVMIPILESLPATGGGSTELTVLGVAVFGIAAWNHDNNQSTYGTASTECSTSTPQPGYECGMVWGYLMEGLQPPDYLLQKITNSDNPFAPLLIALVE